MADVTAKVFEVVERRRIRGTTCHEIADELQLHPRVIGIALNCLVKEGKVETLTSKREGQSVVMLRSEYV